MSNAHDHERLSDTLEIETKHGHTFRVTNATAPKLFIAWASWTDSQQAWTATRQEWNLVLDAADTYMDRSDIDEGDRTADVRAVDGSTLSDDDGGRTRIGNTPTDEPDEPGLTEDAVHRIVDGAIEQLRAEMQEAIERRADELERRIDLHRHTDRLA